MDKNEERSRERAKIGMRGMVRARKVELADIILVDRRATLLPVKTNKEWLCPRRHNTYDRIYDVDIPYSVRANRRMVVEN